MRKKAVAGTPVPWLNIMSPNFSSIPEGPLTLEYPLVLGSLVRKRVLRDVMDTAAFPMCYDYVE